MTGSNRRYDYIINSNPECDGKVRLRHKETRQQVWVPKEKVAEWLKKNPKFRDTRNEGE